MNKDKYSDEFLKRAKQDIKMCEKKHELEIYVAGLWDNIDFWQNEYNYIKKYRDNLQQENKQLKDNWNKLKEYCQLNIDKSNIKFMLEIMQELEKGEENGK